MRKALVMTAFLALVIAGCRAEANFAFDVAADGSGDLTVEFGVDDELLDLVEAFGGSAEDLLGLVPAGDGLTERREGDMTFYSATEAFADASDLADTVSAVSGDELSFDTFDLQVDGEGGASIDAAIVVPDVAEAAAAFGDTGEIDDDVLTSRLTVRLPGVVTESNADDVLPDGTLAWDLPVNGGTIEISAASEAQTSVTPWTRVAVDVSDDGIGNVTLEYGIADRSLPRLEAVDLTPADLIDLSPGDGALSEQRVDDVTFYSVTVPFTDAADLQRQVDRISRGQLSVAPTDLGVTDAGGISFDATVTGQDSIRAADQLGTGLIAPQFTLRLAGEVTAQNADAVASDGTLEWNLPAEGGTVRATAVSEPGSAFPVVPAIIGLVAALLVAAGAVMALRRRDRGTAVIDATDAPPPPAGVFDDTTV